MKNKKNHKIKKRFKRKIKKIEEYFLEYHSCREIPT